MAEKVNLGVLLKKRASLIGSTLRNRSYKFKAELVQRLRTEFADERKRGDIKPIIDKAWAHLTVSNYIAQLRLWALMPHLCVCILVVSKGQAHAAIRSLSYCGYHTEVKIPLVQVLCEYSMDQLYILKGENVWMIS